MTKKEIIERYKTAEEAKIPDGNRLLLICVNKTVEDRSLGVLNAVRYSWKISPDRAAAADYVLAVAFGLIVGVFEVEGEWQEAKKENFSPEIPEHHGNWKHQDGRYGFHGREAPESVSVSYLNKRVPTALRNHGAPIRYVGF
jgi:hypothetical protein